MTQEEEESISWKIGLYIVVIKLIDRGGFLTTE